MVAYGYNGIYLMRTGTWQLNSKASNLAGVDK
jgi:hypothetical protein